MPDWLTRNWWRLLVTLVVLAVLILVYTTVHLTVGVQIDDTGSLIVDLVLVMLTLITLAGYGIYRWIRREIEARVQNQLTAERNVLSARLHASTGFVFWEHRGEHRKSERALLKTAINSTRLALEFTKGLNEKKYEELICRVKSWLLQFKLCCETMPGKMPKFNSYSLVIVLAS